MDKWITLHRDGKEFLINFYLKLQISSTITNHSDVENMENLNEYFFDESPDEILVKLNKPDNSELELFKQLYKDTNAEKIKWFDKANDYACKLTELQQAEAELIDAYRDGNTKPGMFESCINKLEALLEKP